MNKDRLLNYIRQIMPMSDEGFAPIDRTHPLLLITFFIGFSVLSIRAGMRFQGKDKE